jgi:predicted lipid-binding transport protein (Tim44 family)
MNMKRNMLTTVLASAAILAFNTACAETDNEAPQATEAAPVEAAPAEAAPAEAAQQMSEGMRIPVDGSSLEAFENSLETIKGKVTETEYTTLTNAIDYLLVYDLAAKRNREKLAANLDGLTGEEITNKVSWGHNNPR